MTAKNALNPQLNTKDSFNVAANIEIRILKGTNSDMCCN